MPTRELQAELWSVGDLFAEDGTHYEIPIYQRNYTWGAEQIEQLVDDVWAAAQAGDENYFLGNLIVSRRTPSRAATHVTYEVIDGQQRLTTLYLLLRFLESDLSSKLTYQSRRTATEALAGLTRSEDEEGSGIHTGFKVIESRMGRFGNGGNDLARFAVYLREQVQLVRATLPDKTDLNKYFEIMNTRGQQLQQVDIVKARLMSYLREDNPHDLNAARGCFAWIWDACADLHTYIQMALTPGSTELRHRIFGSSWDRLQLAGFGELRSARPQHAPSGDVGQNGSVPLQAALDRYARATKKPAAEDPDKRRFESPIKFSNLLLHALKVMRGSDADLDDDSGRLDDNKLIKLFEAEFKNPSEIDRSDLAKRFAEELLRCKFVLDNFVLKREFTGTNGDDGSWSLRRLVRGESVAGSVSPRFPNAFAPGRDEGDGAPTDPTSREILLLQSMLRVTYTSPRTTHWITSVLRLPITDPKPMAESIQHVLQNYARDQVRQVFFARDEPQGFAIERIVFTYLDYLLAEKGKSDFTFVYRNSIEHFFPQYADPEQEKWDRVGQKDAELHMLGNLALVSVGANSKFSNNLPENKVRFHETIKQSVKLQVMAQQIRDGKLWDRTAISDHHRDMVELLREDLKAAGLQV